MSKRKKKNNAHSFPPFVWRFVISFAAMQAVFLSILLATFFSVDLLPYLSFDRILTFYISVVVLFDGISFTFFEKRMYSNVRPKWVKCELNISLQNLKRYYKSRFLIRIAAFICSIFFIIPTYSFHVFILSYTCVTLIAYIVYYLRNEKIRPQFSNIMERRPHQMYSGIGISPEEWALNKATGFPCYGPVKF